MPAAYVLEGTLDPAALENALYGLIERHQILRTRFIQDEQGNLRQEIRQVDKAGIRLFFRDFRDEPDREAKVKALLQEQQESVFDLNNGPFFRASLFRLSEQQWIFFYMMHHIISDGWSIGIFIKELLQLYNTGVHGQ